MSNIYDAGDLIRLHASVIASGGAMVAPASMYAYVYPPGGPATVFGFPTWVASVGTGAFYLDLVASRPGAWPYRFVATPSAGLSVGEHVFHIRTTPF